MPDVSDLRFFLYIFLMLVAAGVGAPIPEELPVVWAGVWVGTRPTVLPGHFLILPLCIVGAVLCDAMLYGIGRWWGPRLLDKPFMKRLMTPERRKEIEHNFHRHGIKVLLFTRMLPGIRSPVFIMAGVMRLPLPVFLLGDLIYAIPGISLLFFLAYWFGSSFQVLIERFEHDVVGKLKPILILALIAGVSIYFFFHFVRKPVSTGDPKEVPCGEKVAAGMEKVEKTLHLSSADLHLDEMEVPKAAESEEQAAGEKPA